MANSLQFHTELTQKITAWICLAYIHVKHFLQALQANIFITDTDFLKWLIDDYFYFTTPRLLIQFYFLKPVTGSCFALCALTLMQSVRSGRLNECLVLEEFLQESVSMAEVMYFILLFLNCGSLLVVSTRPADDTAAASSSVGSDATFTTTVSPFSAGNANTPNITDIPSTGFTSSYFNSTTKPPTTNKHLAERPGKTTERAVPRKEAEEEEGPVELGKWMTI